MPAGKQSRLSSCSLRSSACERAWSSPCWASIRATRPRASGRRRRPAGGTRPASPAPDSICRALEAVERLGEAGEEVARPPVELGPGGRLVGPGELHGRVDEDQLGDRLGHRERAQGAVLIDGVDGEGGRAHRQDPALARPDGDDLAEVLVEVEVVDGAADLGEVVGPRRADGERLLLDGQAAQEQLAVLGQRPGPGVREREPDDARGRRRRRRGEGRDPAGDEGVLRTGRAGARDERRSEEEGEGSGRHDLHPPGESGLPGRGPARPAGPSWPAPRIRSIGRGGWADDRARDDPRGAVTILPARSSRRGDP